MRDLEKGRFDKETLPADLKDMVNQVNKMSETINHIIQMPKKNGLELLHELRTMTTDFEAIIFSGFGDEKSAVQAMRDGAINFILKPIDLDQLVISVERAMERLKTSRALKYRNRELELTREVIASMTVVLKP